MYYDQDWDLNQISGTYWHNPLVWRMDGDNGSLNSPETWLAQPLT